MTRAELERSANLSDRVHQQWPVQPLQKLKYSGNRYGWEICRATSSTYTYKWSTLAYRGTAITVNDLLESSMQTATAPSLNTARRRISSTATGTLPCTVTAVSISMNQRALRIDRTTVPGPICCSTLGDCPVDRLGPSSLILSDWCESAVPKTTRDSPWTTF